MLGINSELDQADGLTVSCANRRCEDHRPAAAADRGARQEPVLLLRAREWRADRHARALPCNKHHSSLHARQFRACATQALYQSSIS